MEVVHLARKFSLCSDVLESEDCRRTQRPTGQSRSTQGEFVWHRHENEHALFLVVKGRLCMTLRDRDVTISAGEFFIVPKGVEHLPIAEEEVHVVLLEE